MLPKNPATGDTPLELSDEVVEALIKRLIYITSRLERHYLAQSHRLEHSRCVMHPYRQCNCADDARGSDPPF